MNRLKVSNHTKSIEFKITDATFYCEETVDEKDWKSELIKPNEGFYWMIKIFTEPVDNGFKEKYEEIFGHWVSPDPFLYFVPFEGLSDFPTTEELQRLNLEYKNINTISDKYLGGSDGYYPDTINDKISFLKSENSENVIFKWTGNMRYFMDEDFDDTDEINWSILKDDEWSFDLEAELKFQWIFKKYDLDGETGLERISDFVKHVYPSHKLKIEKQESYEDFAKITYSEIKTNDNSI